MTGRRVPPEEVDHIVPHKGDPDLFWPEGDPQDHFAACCKQCHSGIKQKAERAAEKQGKDIREVMALWGLLK